MVCASRELSQGPGEGGCLSPLQVSDDDPCTWEKPQGTAIPFCYHFLS